MRWLALLSIVLAQPAFAQMSPPVPPAVPPSKCTEAVHGAFDFWIGEWRVFRTDDPQAMVGTSTVDRIYNGCAVRETWNPFTMRKGGSLNTYDRHRKVWRQTWIDADNSLVDFEGGLNDGKMVLTGLWRDLDGYPPHERKVMRDVLRGYTVQIIEEAWPEQRAGRVPHAGVEWMDRFQAELFEYEPGHEAQKILHAETMGAYSRLIEAREEETARNGATTPVAQLR
jgi:hypothetical protein